MANSLLDIADGLTAVGDDRIYVARDPDGTPLDRYITPEYLKDFVLDGLAWADITSTPTTLAGYGITDGVTSGSLATTLAGYLTTAAAAATFLALVGGTITGNGAASTPPLKLDGTWFTGGSATTTKPQLLIEPTGTTSTGWSTSGTGLGVNAPSGFTGNLIDCHVNGVRSASILASGAYQGPSASETAPTYGFVGASTTGMYHGGGPNGVAFARAGVLTGYFSGSSVFVLPAAGLDIANNTGTFRLGVSADVVLARGAADTLALARTTNAQTLLIYNTVDSPTSPTNYERLAIGNVAGVMAIVVQKGGTGTNKDLYLETLNRMFFDVSGNRAWAISNSRTLYPAFASSTSMTNGFLNMPGAAGVPSGVPATTTGFPLYYDSTNNKIYVYNGSWRSTDALT